MSNNEVSAMEPKPIRCHIPQLVKRIGKNQQWLADVTGIGKTHLSDIVHLRSNNIGIRRAKMIAERLNCSLDDLFTWDSDSG